MAGYGVFSCVKGGVIKNTVALKSGNLVQNYIKKAPGAKGDLQALPGTAMDQETRERAYH